MRERPMNAALVRALSDAEQRRRSSDAPGAAVRTAAQDLVTAAVAGDVEAVALLYDQLVGPIYRYVAIRVSRREDAEDLTQVVFERIVASLPRYRQNGRPFEAWAFRIARNAVIDHRRRQRPIERLDEEVEPAHGEGLEAITVRDEEIRELRRAIAGLTGDQQEALALRYGAGLSAEEAAQVMGRRAGTVRGLTFRAINALRRRLAANEGGDG
jgi:RNA polymerase sigma-70 factor, ECF subfamily